MVFAASSLRTHFTTVCPPSQQIQTIARCCRAPAPPGWLEEINSNCWNILAPENDYKYYSNVIASGRGFKLSRGPNNNTDYCAGLIFLSWVKEYNSHT